MSRIQQWVCWHITFNVYWYVSPCSYVLWYLHIQYELLILESALFKVILTVQPSVFSASGPLRVQAFRVPVWSVTSTSRSKPVVAEKVWSLAGHSWLVQLSMSSLTRNLHLELRHTHYISLNMWEQCIYCSKSLVIDPSHLRVWPYHRVLMTFETSESRSSLEMKLYVMPKKASGFSRDFCFSWFTVYTSVMESTAEKQHISTSETLLLLNNRQVVLVIVSSGKNKWRTSKHSNLHHIT